MPDTIAPLTLWLTDRTRAKDSLGRCKRKRYLRNHFGPTGYGIVSHAESIPLTTGLAAHQGMEHFAEILLKEDRLTTAPETREIIRAVQAEYEAKVESRGFRGMLAGPQTELVITEQKVLISGLIWALRLRFLPWFHESYRVISAEAEHLHFLSCQCGAGPLDAAEHIRRGCTGRVLMLRRDLLAQRRTGSTLAYFEIKTTGWESDAWAEKWETDPQLGLGTIDTDKQYGSEVTELYIVGLGKGRRQKDKYEDDGVKRQLTPLCYGYCRPGNPPLATDDWLPSYEWINEKGETKRKSKQHRRRGVWELPQSDWPTWRAYSGQDPDMPPEEFWVRTLPTAMLDKVCFVLGPMNRQDHQIEAMRRSIDADEERWQTDLWTLYALQTDYDNPNPEHRQVYGWASPEFQARLDTLVPCSWECRPYGREHQCEYVPICHRQEGWQDPLLSGRYVARRPHHQPELDQAVARGLLIEQAEEVDEDRE